MNVILIICIQQNLSVLKGGCTVSITDSSDMKLRICGLIIYYAAKLFWLNGTMHSIFNCICTNENTIPQLSSIKRKSRNNTLGVALWDMAHRGVCIDSQPNQLHILDRFTGQLRCGDTQHRRASFLGVQKITEIHKAWVRRVSSHHEGRVRCFTMGFTKASVLWDSLCKVVNGRCQVLPFLLEKACQSLCCWEEPPSAWDSQLQASLQVLFKKCI